MALAQPEAVFLISPESLRSLTFRELQERSRFLAGQLLEAGLVRGDKVALMMDNGLFTAQLFLGLNYGGFVAVPLNVRAGCYPARSVSIFQSLNYSSHSQAEAK